DFFFFLEIFLPLFFYFFKMFTTAIIKLIHRPLKLFPYFIGFFSGYRTHSLPAIHQALHLGVPLIKIISTLNLMSMVYQFQLFLIMLLFLLPDLILVFSL